MICDGKISMILSDNFIQAEGLVSFFKNFRRISTKAGKKLATNVIKHPGRALELTSNIATATAGKSPRAALLSCPELINVYHTGKILYLSRFVYFMLYVCTKQIDYTHLHHLKKKY